ncbi:39S ribosomal protein L18, mitochondrial [Exaiptasia diaphana]|uniref:Large ribosomal subunit protein uL18m n=1 Tax=Exaiptasia diaphana TaxID=2652724 RepID=A0A913Y4X3_EXADI|nr:39S ribosomal protein L18, mitochondrial [Exaiptasia diaphana]KXJ28920.1 39S ribosomal protein L18, mitochondrial [Exaiptasia diaphana]
MAAIRAKLFVQNRPQNILNSVIKTKINASSIIRSSALICRCINASAQENVESKIPASSCQPVKTHFTNRNPRNVEYEGKNKPRGYGTQFSRRDFYNKLNFVITNRHIKAYVQHNSGTVLISASTTEFPITKQLYKTTDTTAAVNIGRVLADRCLEAGFTRVCWEPRWVDKHKKRVKAFTTAVQKGGLTLNEPRAVIPLQNFYSDFTPRKAKKKWKKMPNSEKRKFI